jgi:hypothetical protein
VASEHDEKHRACRGSECQIQLHVNSPERRQVLDASVLEALPTLRAAGAKRLDWRSPLQEPFFASDHPLHEYRDGKVLDAIERSDLRSVWSSYWPGRSQKRDAVAIARDSGGANLGPVLVEAKSYPGEFRDTGGGSAA